MIASELPAFREIAGDIPEYVEPLGDNPCGEFVVEYARDNVQARAAQCQRMAGFVLPTWDAHFQQVEALMARLSVATR